MSIIRGGLWQIKVYTVAGSLDATYNNGDGKLSSCSVSFSDSSAASFNMRINNDSSGSISHTVGEYVLLWLDDAYGGTLGTTRVFYGTVASVNIIRDGNNNNQLELSGYDLSDMLKKRYVNERYQTDNFNVTAYRDIIVGSGGSYGLLNPPYNPATGLPVINNISTSGVWTDSTYPTLVPPFDNTKDMMKFNYISVAECLNRIKEVMIGEWVWNCPNGTLNFKPRGYVDNGAKLSVEELHTDFLTCDSSNGWTSTNPPTLVISVDNSIKQEGTGSLKQVQTSGPVGQYIYYNPNQDWRKYHYLDFWVRCSEIPTQSSFQIYANSIWYEYYFTIAQANTWQQERIDLRSLIPNSNLISVATIILKNYYSDAAGDFWIDDIELVQEADDFDDINFSYDDSEMANNVTVIGSKIETPFWDNEYPNEVYFVGNAYIGFASAPLAYDGDESTCYDSSNDQDTLFWYKLDIGLDLVISKMIFTNDSDTPTQYYPRSFKVEASLSGDYDNMYEPIFQNDSNTEAEIEIPFPDKPFRYIKISITANYAEAWKIGEIYLFTRELIQTTMFNTKSMALYGNQRKVIRDSSIDSFEQAMNRAYSEVQKGSEPIMTGSLTLNYYKPLVPSEVVTVTVPNSGITAKRFAVESVAFSEGTYGSFSETISLRSLPETWLRWWT